MNPKELFPCKTLKLGDGKTYKIEFTFRSLLELQGMHDGNIQKVFDMYTGDLNPKDLMYCLWAGLLPHHPEFDVCEEDIKKTITPLIDAESILAVKFVVTETFASFWTRAQQSKKLDPEYQAVLDEFMEQQNKVKKTGRKRSIGLSS